MLRSEKDAASIVKHNETEKSTTEAIKNEGKTTFPMFDFHVHCFVLLKREQMNPSADPPDLVHGLQLGTSPTRAGGQDDVSSN